MRRTPSTPATCKQAASDVAAAVELDNFEQARQAIGKAIESLRELPRRLSTVEFGVAADAKSAIRNPQIRNPHRCPTNFANASSPSWTPSG